MARTLRAHVCRLVQPEQLNCTSDNYLQATTTHNHTEQLRWCNSLPKDGRERDCVWSVREEKKSSVFIFIHTLWYFVTVKWRGELISNLSKTINVGFEGVSTARISTRVYFELCVS